MIRHLLFATSLVLGTVTIAPNAFASDIENVPFGGTVTTACSLPGAPVAGTLGNPTSTTLTSLVVGTKGTAQVKCTGGPGALNISGVTQTAGPSLTSPVYSATAAGTAIAATYTAGVPGLSQTVLPGLTIPLDVNMTVVNGADLTAGTYGFTVNLTVTP